MQRCRPAAGVAIAGVLAFQASVEGAEKFQKLSGSQIRAKLAGMEITDEVHWADVFAANGTLTSYSMGRKNTVPYGLFKCYGFVNPYLAMGESGTGFTFADLDLLWQALKGTVWEIDRSASRGLMCTRGLYVFEHTSPLGSAPSLDH